jgi:hypothetical protein
MVNPCIILSISLIDALTAYPVDERDQSPAYYCTGQSGPSKYQRYMMSMFTVFLCIYVMR